MIQYLFFLYFFILTFSASSQNLIRINNKEYEFKIKVSKEIEKLDSRSELVEFKFILNEDCTVKVIDYGKSRVNARNAINRHLNKKKIYDIIDELYLVEPRFSEKFKRPYAEKVKKIDSNEYCTLLRDVKIYYNESYKDIF